MPALLPRTRLAATATAAMVATAGTAGAGWATYELLTGQARAARTIIPHRTDNAPDADGVYAPGAASPRQTIRTEDLDADIDLMVFGDSTAAGLGAECAEDTLGGQLARMLADTTNRRVSFLIGSRCSTISRPSPSISS